MSQEAEKAKGKSIRSSNDPRENRRENPDWWITANEDSPMPRRLCGQPLMIGSRMRNREDPRYRRMLVFRKRWNGSHPFASSPLKMQEEGMQRLLTEVLPFRSPCLALSHLENRIPFWPIRCSLGFSSGHRIPWRFVRSQYNGNFLNANFSFQSRGWFEASDIDETEPRCWIRPIWME
jgi:hypothetical protein